MDWLNSQAAKRLGSLLSIGLFATYIVAVASAAWFHPFANWDTIPYSAAVERSATMSDQEVHARGYQTVREAVDPGTFRVLTQDRPYRKRQAADPAAFVSMLPFYETKYLYIAAARLVAPAIGTYDALRAITVGSVLALGLLIALWLRNQRALAWVGFVGIALGLSEFGFVAANTVPDLFAAVFVLLAAWAVASRKDWLVPLAMMLAVLVRPDHVAWAGVLMVAALAARLPALPYIATFAAALAAYLFASATGDHPGWWAQFWFTNVEYVETMEGFAPDFSILVYAKALVESLGRAITRETWLFCMASLFIIAAWLAANRRVFHRAEHVLLASLLLTTIAKYAIFPLHEVRFHIATIMTIAVVVACGLSRGIPAETPRG